MYIRLMGLIDASLHLTNDSAFLRGLHESHVLESYNRTDQGCFRQVTVVTVRS